MFRKFFNIVEGSKHRLTKVGFMYEYDIVTPLNTLPSWSVFKFANIQTTQYDYGKICLVIAVNLTYQTEQFSCPLVESVV